MSQVAAADVKKLRDRTNAPFKDCRAALIKTNGDLEKAVEELRLMNSAVRDKKGERETAEGRVGIFIDPDQKIGGILEMRCESAPSAKNELFVEMCEQLAKHVALNNPTSVEEFLGQKFSEDNSKTVQDRIDDVVGLIRENMKPARMKKLEGLLGHYVHHDGTVGVLLQVEGDNANEELLNDVCMHVAAIRPAAATKDKVDPALIENEKKIAIEQAKATGKPDNIVEKIAEGKLNSWYKENVLTEQPFVKDDSKTVGEHLKGHGLTVVDFVCYKVGEAAS